MNDTKLFIVTLGALIGGAMLFRYASDKKFLNTLEKIAENGGNITITSK